ncbi:pyridoxamine 5'-phosphate oxidase family protein [Sebaldella sp. S0638]|uniref:pyridoxamine 5'-phosphate oxidase family protein n=1 Tax=Sebaldella sp. S0638 TaxID=2957809 RepID=UPI00209E7507|nr:pyridoxamine 5'-phosphate oxidase family protein [Sebaldella sp. S0638]MCP1224006.1 pyridoxamine 5'-phosphate oxidase family protein [Sebaldella sp. S0638]
MKEVIEFLIQNPVQFLATAGLDNKPKVRPFQFMFEYDNKLWFCTGTKKEVYMELQKSPYIELSVLSNNMKWLRISGKVIFSDSEIIKKKIINQNKLVKSIYQTWDNPALTAFYLKDCKAVITDLSGKLSVQYSF